MNQDTLIERVKKLESSLAFLQHDFEAQNETILLQTQQINKLENSIKKLLSKIETLEDGGSKRDPLDENRLTIKPSARRQRAVHLEMDSGTTTFTRSCFNGNEPANCGGRFSTCHSRGFEWLKTCHTWQLTIAIQAFYA